MKKTVDMTLEMKIMNEEIDKLLQKYQEVEAKMLVMDDYDGGQMHMVQLIIADLKKLKKFSLWG